MRYLIAVNTLLAVVSLTASAFVLRHVMSGEAVLRVRGLEVVDAEGRTRVELDLSVGPYLRFYSKNPAQITVAQDTKVARSSISMGLDFISDEASFGLSDRSGTSKLWCGVLSDGSPKVRLGSSDVKGAIVMTVAQNSPALVMHDVVGRPKMFGMLVGGMLPRFIVGEWSAPH